MLLIVLACSSSPAPPAPVEPAPPEVQEVQTPQLYVHASVLNLRDDAGKRIGRLDINTPLEPLGREGDKLRVRVANGTEGWVAAGFVGEYPLQAEPLHKEAMATEDKAERLALLQRAAAISPSEHTMRALIEAYENLGEFQKAERVRAQIAWPDWIRPVPEPSAGAELEWTIDWDLSGDAQTRERKAKAQIPVKPGDPVWVLPANGPAVQGTLGELSLRGRNDCSGEVAWMAPIEVALPQGALPIAIALKPPPESWSGSRQPARQSRAEALAAFTAWAEPKGLPTARIADTLHTQDGLWYAAILGDNDDPSLPMNDFGYATLHTLRMQADGQVAQIAERSVDYDREDPFFVLSERDLDGDGDLETVKANACATRFEDAAGHELSWTAYRCCGC